MKNILIIKHGAYGDVIRTSYFLRPLYDQYGKPNIFWLTSQNSFHLLRFNPYIFQLTYEISDLVNTEFDWVISLDDEYDILKKSYFIKYKKITGAFLENEERTYSTDSALWFDMGLISKFGKKRADELKKLNTLGHAEIFSKVLNIKGINPVFYNSPVIEQKVKKSSNYLIIGINSGAGGRWESKKLCVIETVKLILKLQRQNVDGKKVFFYLLGGKDEEKRNRKIMSLIDNKQNVRVVDSQGSLLLFAAIIKSCDYLISSDSLALHMAISQKIPNLSFYAPTSAVEIDTFGTGVKVISSSDDYCNYSSKCDNTSLTAERIEKVFNSHIDKIFKS